MAFLRASGTRVLTLVDPDDSIVRPEESLLPAPGESLNDLQLRARFSRPGSLGHGAMLDDPLVWQRVLTAIGPQTQSGTRANDPIDEELRALKTRLRKEGRIR